MSRALIRHLRMFCQSPDATPVRHHDGILAVAGVLEDANLARLLLVDMERFGRNRGASVTNAIQRVAPAAEPCSTPAEPSSRAAGQRCH